MLALPRRQRRARRRGRLHRCWPRGSALWDTYPSPVRTSWCRRGHQPASWSRCCSCMRPTVTSFTSSQSHVRAPEPGGFARKPEARWATSSVIVLCQQAAETDGIHFPSAEMITAFSLAATLPRGRPAPSERRATSIHGTAGVTRARGARSRGSGQPAGAPSGASERNVAASLH